MNLQEHADAGNMIGTADLLRVSTPGRVCLFGEHQDYLKLPVIPSAIALRIAVEGCHRSDRKVHIALPDVSAEESFSLTGPLEYVAERDYFRSAVNVLRREGLTFSRGFDCIVRGAIPINAGTSSSSALTVTWVNFLAHMSDQRRTLTPDQCARLAHAAEVVEFHEPGGMMDHYSTAYGGVIAIDFLPQVNVEQIDVSLGRFVLGDSLEPKDTKGILARVKNRVLDAASRLSTCHEDFALERATAETIGRHSSELGSAEAELLRGTIRNRDITGEARMLLKSHPLDHRRLGSLLTEHQSVLRDVLKISTPKIDRMLDAALAAGALGGKINGSGGGGCMFAYAPENAETVAEAIARAGGKPYIVSSDAGTRIDHSLTGI